MERAEADHVALRRSSCDGGFVSREAYELRRAEALTSRAQYDAEINTARQLYQTLLAQRPASAWRARRRTTRRCGRRGTA